MSKTVGDWKRRVGLLVVRLFVRLGLVKGR